MRTTINLPDELIEEVMELSGAKTRTEAITTALSNYARRLRRRKLKELRDSEVIDGDFDVMRLREAEKGEYECSD